MVTSITDLANQVGFKGTPSHRTAEPKMAVLQSVNNSVPNQSNITTSVDCYVSGQYVQRNGKVIEVTQRYQIFVSYGQATQFATMDQVRNRIIQDFEGKYGKSFNVVNTHVPTLPVPTKPVLPGTTPGQSGDIEMYAGSGLFRDMTEFEKTRYDIKTQRVQSQTNIESIKDRYKDKTGRRFSK